jgi:hypothetical protein
MSEFAPDPQQITEEVPFHILDGAAKTACEVRFPGAWEELWPAVKEEWREQVRAGLPMLRRFFTAQVEPKSDLESSSDEKSSDDSSERHAGPVQPLDRSRHDQAAERDRGDLQRPHDERGQEDRQGPRPDASGPPRPRVAPASTQQVEERSGRAEHLLLPVESLLHSLVEILPITGSWDAGYTVGAAGSTVKALPEEWATAAQAFSDLHEAIFGRKGTQQVEEEPRYTLEQVEAALTSDEAVEAVALHQHQIANTRRYCPQNLDDLSEMGRACKRGEARGSLRRALDVARDHFTQQPAGVGGDERDVLGDGQVVGYPSADSDGNHQPLGGDSVEENLNRGGDADAVKSGETRGHHGSDVAKGGPAQQSGSALHESRGGG